MARLVVARLTAELVELLVVAALLTAEDSESLEVASFACFVRVVVGLALELVVTLTVVVVVVEHGSPDVVAPFVAEGYFDCG